MCFFFLKGVMVGKVFFDRNMLLCEMVGAICLIGK